MATFRVKSAFKCAHEALIAEDPMVLPANKLKEAMPLASVVETAGTKLTFTPATLVSVTASPATGAPLRVSFTWRVFENDVPGSATWPLPATTSNDSLVALKLT
ncbi:MAG: hypothetical protein WCI18_07370 [Pseudomonadota bacterium]